MQKQIAEGDMSARNARRRSESGQPAVQPLQINNKSTMTLQNSLTSLKQKVAQLNKLIEQLLALNQVIANKRETAVAIA